MLIPELGLKNTRKNRRWLAIFRTLAECHGGAQERHEAATWAVLSTIGALRRAKAERRRVAVACALQQHLRIGKNALAPLAEAVEQAYLQAR